MASNEQVRVIKEGSKSWNAWRVANPTVRPNFTTADPHGIDLSEVDLRDVAKQHAMVCSFITSTEYQQRFGLPVTHTNAECPH